MMDLLLLRVRLDLPSQMRITSIEEVIQTLYVVTLSYYTLCLVHRTRTTS
jgi:hypothetical protein